MSKMELIEVNELKAYLVKLYSPGDQDVTETDRTVNRVFDIIELLPVIKLELPNIGEKPHGKWNEIVEPFGWDDIKSAQCSACGESYPYPTDCGFDDIVEMFKFCPECGAQMEAGTRWKEDEEDENGSI